MKGNSSGESSENRLSLLVFVFFTFVFLSVFMSTGRRSTSVVTMRIRITRPEIVKSFFSAQNGSHKELEAKIKSTLTDPDSYEHVETHFRDDKKTIHVLTTFRSENASGRTTVNYAEGTLNGNDGRLISWKFVKPQSG